MSYNFTVFCKNLPVARVFVSDDHKRVSIQKLVPDGMKQPFSGDKLDLERVYDFLKGRCYEDEFVGLEDFSGYEGTAEYLASLVLSCSNVELYVHYEKCLINGKKGCVSDNFLKEDEVYISLDRLHICKKACYVDKLCVY